MRWNLRLAVLLGAAVALSAACTGAPPPVVAPFDPSAWNGDPVVRTRFGAVRGREDADGTWSWKGIPFAAPPVGELRWRAPRDPAPWAGVRDASRFGSAGPQFNAITGAITGCEDCLYLNVWRPRDAETDLPVYVWIHGGGNSIGSSSMVSDYYGNRLAARSRVVFVSVNYRLGPLGWFALPALQEGLSPEDDSGNYGTLDLVQALRWIRDNIAAFGGDPLTVLIAGQSAGGMNVLSLVASPLAAGLFHRALVQSGASWTTPIAQAEERARRALRLLLRQDWRAGTDAEADRVAEAMSPAALRTYLRSKSARQILSCYRSVALGMSDNPSLIRDGAVLPADGYRALETGTSGSRVPLVIGTNRDEVKLFQAFSGRMDWRGDRYRAMAQYGSDRWKAYGVDAVSRRLTAVPGQPPVYAYQFLWGAPGSDGRSVLPGDWGRRLGSFHSLEVPFFLGTDTIFGVAQWLLFSASNEPGRKDLSEAMMRYIARFIRTGDPNGPDLPRWDPWSNEPGGPKTLLLDADLARARIAMSSLEYTPESVTALLRDAFPAEVVDEVLASALMNRSDFEE